MRFLALSDIHNSVKRFRGILESQKPYDGILIAGDLTTHGTVADIRDIFADINTYSLFVFCVAGNMDSVDIDQELLRLGYGIHSTGVIVNSIGICGVSAAPWSILHTPYEVGEEEIFKNLKKGWSSIENAQWKIILSHTPPRGTTVDKVRFGAHVGSTALRSFIEEYQPNLVVCGHIHEASGVDRINNTLILNCGSVADGKFSIVEIDKEIRIEQKVWKQ